MIGGRSAAPTDDVEPAIASEILDVIGHPRWGQIVFSKRIRESGIWVAGYRCIGDLGKLLDVGTHDVWSHGTVHADTEHWKVAHGIPKGFDGLGANKRSAPGPERRAEHYRDFASGLGKVLSDRIQTGLEIESIDCGLRQQDIGSCLDQMGNLDFVAGDHFQEVDISVSCILDLGADRELFGGRSDTSSNVAATRWIGFANPIDRFASAIDGRIVKVSGQFFG